MTDAAARHAARNTVHRILVPTDFSDCARGALRWALTLAHHYDADVHLLHVVTLQNLGVYGTDDEVDEAASYQQKLEAVYQARARELLDEVLEDEQRTDVPVTTVVRQSMAIADAVLGYVAEVGADLIVAGTHGRRGVQHLVLGSVAEDVMREAPCPVLLVRQREDAATAEPGPRILVPVDFSVPSRRALSYAAQLAERVGARLHLLHVVEPLPFPVSLTGILTIHDLLPDINDKAEQHLRRLAEDAGTDAAPPDVHVQEGYPAAAIVRAAADLEVSLIVMASRGLAGLERLLVGSVTTRVVRAAPCPVLVIRDERVADVPRHEEAAAVSHS
ncbi:MAG: universal stress protein [Bacteroidetes bacterium]|jgi:nucleotide-binding universal stress UspA family protein|nr:universal stress protein [Bacteroidota bacterium]